MYVPVQPPALSHPEVFKPLSDQTQSKQRAFQSSGFWKDVMKHSVFLNRNPFMKICTFRWV